MNTFLLEIITPERQAFAEQVESVYAPTSKGTIGILAHHQSLFTSLEEGEVKIAQGKKELFLAIGGGFMEVTGKKVSILVSAAYHAHELNEVEIKKAQASAKEVLSTYKKGEERARAQALLRRSVLELKVLRRRAQRSSMVS